jgi:hypothetical protein
MDIQSEQGTRGGGRLVFLHTHTTHHALNTACARTHAHTYRAIYDVAIVVLVAVALLLLALLVLHRLVCLDDATIARASVARLASWRQRVDRPDCDAVVEARSMMMVPNVPQLWWWPEYYYTSRAPPKPSIVPSS